MSTNLSKLSAATARVYRKVAIVVVLGVVLVGCATTSLVQTGETIDAIGKQFVATAKMYNTYYDAGLVTKDEYRTWAAFAKRFKVFYPQLVDTWMIFADAPDAKGAVEIAQQINTLKNQLLVFYLAAIQKGEL